MPVKKKSAKPSVKKVVKLKIKTDKKMVRVKASIKSKRKLLVRKKKGGNLLTGLAVFQLGSKALHKLYSIKKAYDYDKGYSVMNVQVKDKDDAIKVAFDPKISGDWKGESGLSLLFLKEHLMKEYSNACTLSDDVAQVQFRTGSLDIPTNIIRIKNDVIFQDWESMAYPDMFFKQELDKCNKRFFIINISTISSSGLGHANMLIIDKTKGIVEHFDPYGSNMYHAWLTGASVVAKRLKTIFSSIGYNYLSVGQTCPVIGPQAYEELLLCSESMIPQLTNKVGMCLVWSLFFVHLRLKYPNEDSKMLISNAIGNMGTDLCKFIKGYAQTILELAKNYELVKDNTSGIVVDYRPKTG